MSRKRIDEARLTRLFRIGGHLGELSEAICNAAKPHDLVYPTTRGTELLNQIRREMWLWINTETKKPMKRSPFECLDRTFAERQQSDAPSWKRKYKKIQPAWAVSRPELPPTETN